MIDKASRLRKSGNGSLDRGNLKDRSSTHRSRYLTLKRRDRERERESEMLAEPCALAVASCGRCGLAVPRRCQSYC